MLSACVTGAFFPSSKAGPAPSPSIIVVDDPHVVFKSRQLEEQPELAAKPVSKRPARLPVPGEILSLPIATLIQVLSTVATKMKTTRCLINSNTVLQLRRLPYLHPSSGKWTQ